LFSALLSFGAGLSAMLFAFLFTGPIPVRVAWLLAFALAVSAVSTVRVFRAPSEWSLMRAARVTSGLGAFLCAVALIALIARACF
jgi:hypothetical protein